MNSNLFCLPVVSVFLYIKSFITDTCKVFSLCELKSLFCSELRLGTLVNVLVMMYLSCWKHQQKRLG